MESHDRPRSSELGRVVSTAPQDLLVVDTEDEPADLGTRCETRDGSPAGVVVDVIGSVGSPALVVDTTRGPKPDRDHDAASLVGTQLHAR